MASPRHYGRCTRDITNVMQKLQGRCKMLTHSHCSTLVCSGFRGDLALGMTQQNSVSPRHLTVTVKMPDMHLLLLTHDPVSFIFGELEFKFIELIDMVGLGRT